MMLHPLRLEQKNSCEEDSPDSGSELGLEPETDRFGFLLTEESTDGVRRAGPSPALVRQREAKWINIIDQWDQLHHKKASKIKMQCQKGIPASLRAKCWTLLSGARDRIKQQADLYKTLDTQPALKHWEDVIKRDLDRQFPYHEMFVSKDGHGQRSLFQVLKAYTQFKPEDGYCQAQGPVAAVLLMNMPTEEAFWSLVQICEQYLPGYYSPLLEGVLFDAALLTWVLKRSCPAAHRHLLRHGVEPLMFATDWLMCLFTRHLPFNTLLRVWDLFFCYGVRVLLQVAAVMVHRVLGHEDQRKQCCGQMETLQTLREVKKEVKDEEDDFINEVLSVPLSARDLQRQTEKELQQWQKERPSSTFDPRGRCLGNQMAWVRFRQSNEECERKEREKGNLSMPLFRSASTLSLSKWQKGVKMNSGERKRNVKVVRHLSMGAQEDCRSWAHLNYKKMESLEDDGFVLLGGNKESGSRLNHETQQTELLEESEHQQTDVQDVPQINVHRPTEQMKENSKSLADTNKQEEHSESQIEPGVQLMRENNLFQVTSLKLLATQAIRHLELSSKNVINLKNLEETREQNNEIDKCLGKLSVSEEYHFSASLTGTKNKNCRTLSNTELCELAANTCSIEQGNVDTIQIQTHFPNTDKRKFTQDYSNDIQVINQSVTVEEISVSEATVSGQTTEDSLDSTKTCDQTEDTTHCQELQEDSSDGNLNTEVDNTNHGAPERDTQSNIYQIRKNCSATQQIEHDFTDTNQQYSFRSSGDFRVRKSSSCHGSRLARRLSEDLFTTPQSLDKRTSSSSQGENDEASQIPKSHMEEEAASQKEEQPRRFGLFRRLREEKKKKKQSKIQVPKIIIQDFSDDRDMGQGAEVDTKATHREKKRRWKVQKKKEKEGSEKEGQRGQTEAISVHAQSDKTKQKLGSAASKSTHKTSYAELYF